MINRKKTLDRLKGIIDNDENAEFVIYPFGDNGVTVKNILMDYFGIKPTCIVDNNLCKYNSNIINSTQLEKLYSKQYILLTVESAELREELKAQIVSFVDSAKLIDLGEKEKKPAPIVDLNKFKFNTIFPELRNIDKEKGRIKVRFLSTHQNNWNSNYFLFMSFVEDVKCDCMIIGNDNSDSEEFVNTFTKLRCKYIPFSKYHCEDDLPDIMILNHDFDSRDISALRKYCRFIVYASNSIVCGHGWRSFFDNNMGVGRYNPNIYIFDDYLVYNLTKEYKIGENVVAMGNGRYDCLFRASNANEFPSAWSKLSGKKIVFWGGTHGLYSKAISYSMTFDLYASTIFDYFSDKSDMGLIFRPHSEMLKEFVKNGCWSEDEVEKLKHYCEQTDNIVFDMEYMYKDNFVYDLSQIVADGIITDLNTGLVLTSLPLCKPVCIAARPDSIDFNPELSACNYFANTKEKIVEFLDMIRVGQDYKYEQRVLTRDRFIPHFDGKNGYRMKEYILNCFYNT